MTATPSPSLKRQALKGLLWDFGGKLSNQAVSFLIGILLARLLTPEAYGLIGMVMVFIAYSQIFINLGLSAAIVQRKDIHQAHYDSSFYLNLAVGLILTILFQFLAPVIANFYDEPELTTITRWLALNFVISSLTVVQSAQLTRNLQFKVLTKASVISAIVSGIIGVVMAYLGFGVWSLIIQQLVESTLKTFLLWFQSAWRPGLQFDVQALRELWSFGSHMFLSNALDNIFVRIDALVIGKLFSATQLGLFTRAKTLNRFIINFSSSSLSHVTFPVLSKIQDDPERFRRIFLNSTGLVSFVACGLVGAMYLLARPLILLLLTEKWEASIEYFRILCFSAIFYPISAITLSGLKALGKSRIFFQIEVLKKSIFAIGMVIGFMGGIEGYLYALVIIYAINSFLNIYFTSRAISISSREQINRILPYIFIVAVCIFAVQWLPIWTMPLFWQLILGGSAFAACYLLLNAVLKTEGFEFGRQQLQPFFQRFMQRG